MTQNIPNPSAPVPSRYQPYQAPPPQPEKNGIGLAALIIAIVGFIFACWPGALIIGWVLLPVAFVLSIVGLARSGRKKGTSLAAMIVSVVGAVVGVIVFMTVVADAFEEAFDTADSDLSVDSKGPASKDADANAADESKASDEADAVEGSRENPLQIGQTVHNEDWEITPGAPYEATKEVLAENQFNDEPLDGFEFWILPITATYIGEDSGHAGFEISVKFVSDEGRTYNDYDPSCGVIPDDLTHIDEIYNGATVEGNMCIPVPDGADGLWTVSALFGDPVFFEAD